ncbi:hypothetical protein DWF00_03115 [Bosea caraganae]|uniref:Right-handed parallel beta-helix repeat-containing protein n=1 Tax=Bosea caraganae TaxID=2763117 RepID=A0A370L4T7_9HYPH|nr:right-handed parallel beta-helix repeat-containing protein [Bosea caraganae]RDJ24097.1 hypothetical protein DWE98_14345 [Bosea caraganae]RDJ30139.1 hypothetical protein DWF00_03115 [Bosea caraganae]
MATIRYTKAGGGRADGSNWADAKPLAALDQDLRRAAAADSFLLGFDRDREDPVFWSQIGIVLNRPGAAQRPIRLAVGYVGHQDDVQPIEPQSASTCFINSAISPLKRAGPAMTGEPYLKFSNAAGFIDVAGFTVRGAPNDGFIRFDQAASPYSQVSLRGIHAERVGRVIETLRGARLSNVVIENCSAFAVARGFARFRSIENSILRNIVADGGGLDGTGENVCQMLAFETASNITLDSVFLNNAVNMSGAGEGKRSNYVQGDGIVCERETSDFTFRNCHVSAMGDGGFDLKTRNVTMEDCSALRCKFGLRIWSDGTNVVRRTAIHSPRPAGPNHGACVWFAGKADLIDCDLQAGAYSAVFQSGEGGSGAPKLRLFGGSIRTDGNFPMLVGSGGGVVELNDVAVNGEMRTATLKL